MINEKYAKQFCKDDISKIENYEQAMNDTTKTWHCHHRLELTLDGEHALSKVDLIRMDMYYKRPYFELIFLTSIEHHRLHNTGKLFSEETRKKISEALKGEKNPWYGKRHCEETRKKIGEAYKGKTWKLIDGKRVWLSKEASNA